MPMMIFHYIHLCNSKRIGDFIATNNSEEGDVAEEDGGVVNDIDNGVVDICFFVPYTTGFDDIQFLLFAPAAAHVNENRFIMK